MVAKALQLALQTVGMSATRYADAEAAFSDSKIASADVYVSDLRLPRLNGVEFLEQIQRRSTKPFKAALLTGDTSAERIEIAKASPWTLLFKPINLPGLIAAIKGQDG